MIFKIPLSLIVLLVYFLYICVFLCSSMPWAGQRTPSTMWVPGMKLGSSGLAASDSICWPTLQALMASFWTCLPTLSSCCHQSELPSCLQSFIPQPKSHTTSSRVSLVSSSSLKSAWLKLDLLCLSKKGLLCRFCCAMVWTQMPRLDSWLQSRFPEGILFGEDLWASRRDEWSDRGRFLELSYPWLLSILFSSS